MARPAISHALRMRALKYEDAPDAERDRAAQTLRDAGRLPEALLLYEGRSDHPFVGEIVRTAAGRGEGFLLLAATQLGRLIEPETWRVCAQAAEQRGRFMEARHAWLALGDTAALQRLADALPPSLRPEPAPGA